MRLRDAVSQYIKSRRALGGKFVTEAQVLHFFLKGLDEDIGCDDATPDQARHFLEGHGKLTQTRALKFCVLDAFFGFAISRGYASSSPMPLRDDEPRKPSPPPPYVYTRDELCRLFDAVRVSQARAFQIDAETFLTLLLLLYGAGLRGGEAFRLTFSDVDLSNAVLTVRISKFYKSRLVPVGPQLADALRAYAKLRATRPRPAGKDSTFLANQDGTPLSSSSVYSVFQKVRCTAGLDLTDRTRQLPSLHSLRHTFAVHRLTAWYREGADVQRLLPLLSTYLGHATLASTQVYLTMTPELLQQASLRFERYARGDEDA